MSWKKYKHICLWLFVAAALSFIIFYYYMTLLPGEDNKTPSALVLPAVERVIKPETKVYIGEQYAVCQKHQLSCGQVSLLEGNAREALAGDSEEDLKEKYPAQGGWSIVWEGEDVLLQQVWPGLCPEHKKRWHLAPDETGQRIAVYLGPAQVGKEGGVYRETEIELERLSPDLQERIKNGSMEYLTWEEVVATLDSLDE